MTLSASEVVSGYLLYPLWAMDISKRGDDFPLQEARMIEIHQVMGRRKAEEAAVEVQLAGTRKQIPPAHLILPPRRPRAGEGHCQAVSDVWLRHEHRHCLGWMCWKFVMWIFQSYHSASCVVLIQYSSLMHG